MKVREILGRLRPSRALFGNLALVLVSGLCALILAEFAVRLVAPQQLILIRPDLWQPADTVGWLHRPDVAVQINTGERTVDVFTDSRGFRVGASGASHGDKQVLLLGDSFMEALQVDHEQSAAGLLEEAMSQRIGSSVAVRNAAIGGWDPDQYGLRARTLLAEDDYDLVLTAVYLGNDVITYGREYLPPRRPVERYRFSFPRGVSWDAFIDAILRPLNDMLEVRSHLFIFVKNRLQTLRMELGLAPVSFPQQFMRGATDGRWSVTAGLLEDIDRQAREHGAASLFVLIPSSFQVDSTALRRYVEGFDLDRSSIDLEQPNRELRRELVQRGVPFLDVLEDFRVAHKGGERLYGSVDQHFSPDGHRLFATLVAPAAARQLQAAGDASQGNAR